MSSDVGLYYLVINKSDSRFTVVRFRNHSYDCRPKRTPLSPIAIINHEYDYRRTSDDTKSHYQLIINITISDCKCPITRKCPINALIGGFIDQSDSRKL